MSRLADAVAGAPILAAWHNTNRDRTVVPFTNAAQRASEWPSPPAGAMSYLNDSPGILWYYDAGAWSAVGSSRRTGATWRRNANQSITNGVDTAISWDVEDADTNTYAAVPFTVLTMPTGTAGLYAITARVTHSWANNGALETLTIACSNAGTYIFEATANNAMALGIAAALGAIPLAALETVTVRYLQGTGGAQNVTGRLDVYRIGP